LGEPNGKVIDMTKYHKLLLYSRKCAKEKKREQTTNNGGVRKEKGMDDRIYQGKPKKIKQEKAG